MFGLGFSSSGARLARGLWWSSMSKPCLFTGLGVFSRSCRPSYVPKEIKTSPASALVRQVASSTKVGALLGDFCFFGRASHPMCIKGLILIKQQYTETSGFHCICLVFLEPAFGSSFAVATWLFWICSFFWVWRPVFRVTRSLPSKQSPGKPKVPLGRWPVTLFALQEKKKPPEHLEKANLKLRHMKPENPSKIVFMRTPAQMFYSKALESPCRPCLVLQNRISEQRQVG